MVVMSSVGVDGYICTFWMAVQVPEFRYSRFMEVGAYRKFTSMRSNVFSSPKSTRRNSLAPLRDSLVLQNVFASPSWTMKTELLMKAKDGKILGYFQASAFSAKLSSAAESGMGSEGPHASNSVIPTATPPLRLSTARMREVTTSENLTTLALLPVGFAGFREIS